MAVAPVPDEPVECDIDQDSLVCNTPQDPGLGFMEVLKLEHPASKSVPMRTLIKSNGFIFKKWLVVIESFLRNCHDPKYHLFSGYREKIVREDKYILRHCNHL